MADLNKVIEFPKDRSRRQRRFLFAQQQKNIFALSLLSVFVLSIMLNQLMLRQKTEQGRQIASLRPFEENKDLLWDQKMANLISHAPHGRPADEPNLKDQILFGVFKGNYHLQIKEGKIEAIVLNENSLTQGVVLKNQDEFLNEFSRAFSRNFVNAVLTEKSNNSSNYQLLNSSGHVVGSATIETDDKGLVQKLVIK